MMAKPVAWMVKYKVLLYGLWRYHKAFYGNVEVALAWSRSAKQHHAYCNVSDPIPLAPIPLDRENPDG